MFLFIWLVLVHFINVRIDVIVAFVVRFVFDGLCMHSVQRLMWTKQAIMILSKVRATRFQHMLFAGLSIHN